MHALILAAGRAATQTLAAPTPAGATAIALAGADIIFAAGDPLFAGPPGGPVQWLGRAARAAPDRIEFTRALRRALPAGALLWRPVLHHMVPAAPALPLRRTFESGVATARAAAGNTWAVRIAAPRETLALDLAALTPAGETELTAWLRAATADGLDPFALIEPAGRVLAVRLLPEPWQREHDRGGRARLRVALECIAEEAYP